MRSLYLSVALELRRRLPDACRVVEISPLLREVLRRALRLKTLDRRIAEQRHLLAVLLDELTRRAGDAARSADAARCARRPRHSADPVGAGGAEPHTLAEIARADGGEPADAGAAVSQRDRIAVRRLAAAGPGCCAPAVARRGRCGATWASAVGYESASAFVAAFRRALGTTPGRYFKQAVAGGEAEDDPGAIEADGSTALEDCLMKLGAIPQNPIERIGKALGLLPEPLLDTHIAMLLARAVMEGSRLGVFEALADGPLTAGGDRQALRRPSAALRASCSTRSPAATTCASRTAATP